MNNDKYDHWKLDNNEQPEGPELKEFIIEEVTDIELADVNAKDYPDFCDAYISAAVWKDSGNPLTENELDLLNENAGDYINEAAAAQVMGA